MIKFLTRFTLVALLLANTLQLNAQDKVYEPTWKSLETRKCPQWFPDAKFGIFIHWGLYSVPSYTNKGTYAEWYWNALNEDPNTSNTNRRNRHIAITKFHEENYGKDFQYSQFRDDFTCELFNPKEWANIFERSGAKYVVLTSKHHDGYCLWGNKEASKSYGMAWNSVDSGPKRDLVGELTNEVRKTDVKMGLYYSIWDWYNPYWDAEMQKCVSSGNMSVNFNEKDDTKTAVTKKDIEKSKKGLSKYIHEVMYPQFKELVNKYQPSLIFSDGDWWMNDDLWETRPMLAWLFNNAPNKDEVVINDRWGQVRGKYGSYLTTEYGSGFNNVDKPWEENRGIGMSFGLNRIENIDDYRTEQELIYLLVDLVSRGGNLLLNIGPAPDGTIPVVMQERLLEIGNWLKVNGEAIYGTTHLKESSQWSLDGKIPTFKGSDFHGGFPLFEQTLNPKPGNAVKEMWFTQNGKTLYALTPGWPKTNKLVVRDIEVKAGSEIKLLGLDRALPYKMKDGGVEVDLSSVGINDIPCHYIYSFKIERK